MFLGDVFDWEQKKLGEVLSSFDYGLNAASKKYDGKNKYLRITDIDDITHKFKYDNLTSPKSNDIISNNFKLNTGDIVFARTGASVGKTYQYDINDGDVYFAGYLIRGKTLPQNNPSFIFDTTLLDKYKNFVRIMSIRSGQPGINAEEYKKYNIFIPKYTEQNKVANLLKKISDFEATQQRKLDQLKLLKKGLLQKMFADEKSKVPKIRFKGFNEKWEQRKLGDVTNRITRKNKNLQTKRPLTISAQLGLIDQHEYFGKQIASTQLEHYIVLKKGEFAYNKSYSTDYPYGAIKRLNRYSSGALSTLYIAFIPTEVNTNYLDNYFSSSKWYKEIYKRATEGARNHGLLNISPVDFFEMNFKVPQKSEQQKIGYLLNKILDLEATQQKKLTQLQQLKKFLLQNMFI